MVKNPQNEEDDKFAFCITKGKFKDLYDDFCKESRDELFDTKEEAIKFYSKPENYKLLLSGDILHSPFALINRI